MRTSWLAVLFPAGDGLDLVVLADLVHLLAEHRGETASADLHGLLQYLVASSLRGPGFLVNGSQTHLVGVATVGVVGLHAGIKGVIAQRMMTLRLLAAPRHR